MLFYIIGILAVIFMIIYYVTTQDKKVAGVYSQPNSFFTAKYWIFRLLFSLRQRRKGSSNDVGLGFKSRSSVEDMETVQKLPIGFPKASFFYEYLYS